jgi:membrane protein YdbS with pleckstrin-like domain
MERLDPRAIWLFFCQFFITGLFFFLIVTLPWITVVILDIISSKGERDLSLKIINFCSEHLIFILTIFILYTIFCYVWAKLTFRAWRYQLEEDAIRIEKGVIWKKYISIPYERIQNVDIYRGILARLLGLSDLHIQTAGYSGYGRYGWATEGRLQGLDIKIAEELRNELIKKIKGTKQGL